MPKDEQKTKKWDSTKTCQLDKIIYLFIYLYFYLFIFEHFYYLVWAVGLPTPCVAGYDLHVSSRQVSKIYRKLHPNLSNIPLN